MKYLMDLEDQKALSVRRQTGKMDVPPKLFGLDHRKSN